MIGNVTCHWCFTRIVLLNRCLTISAYVWEAISIITFCQPTSFDPNTYSAQLQAKLASLQDSVHTNILASAQQQKIHHDKHSHIHSFVAGAPVWLSIPTRGKLQPKWQGKWEVLEIKNPTDVKITNGQVNKETDCDTVSNLNTI